MEKCPLNSVMTFYLFLVWWAYNLKTKIPVPYQNKHKNNTKSQNNIFNTYLYVGFVDYSRGIRCGTDVILQQVNII